jgi:Domain of unknown function (DUF4174)
MNMKEKVIDLLNQAREREITGVMTQPLGQQHRKEKAGRGMRTGRQGNVLFHMSMFQYHFMSILLVGMMVSVASGKGADPVDLDSYQGKNRLLILFAPSEDASMYQPFKEQLQIRTQEIRDRDLVTFHVFESGEGRLNDRPLHKEQVLSLRKRFSIKSGQCTVILIGKDGEVKFREPLPVDLSDIFAIIDAMPMRQREMRERSE